MLFHTSLISISLSLFVSLSASQGSGLSSTVPPPPCLSACFTTVGGDCALCTPNGNTAINQCINSSCFRDTSYAQAYYYDVCQEGGYLSYAYDPPKFVIIPPAPETCAAASKEKRAAVAVGFEG